MSTVETEYYEIPHLDLKIKLPKGFKVLPAFQNGPRDLTLRLTVEPVGIIQEADGVCRGDSSEIAKAQSEISKFAKTEKDAKLAINLTDFQTYQERLYSGPVKVVSAMTTCFGDNEEGEDPVVGTVSFKSIFFRRNYRVELGYWSVSIPKDITERKLLSRLESFASDPAFEMTRKKWIFLII